MIINDLASPKNDKEVQKLSGMVVALNQFNSIYSDKLDHFFNFFANIQIFYGMEKVRTCTLIVQTVLNQTTIGKCMPMCSNI